MPLNLLLFLQTCVESGGPATCLTTAYSQQPCCGDLVCVNSTCKPSVNVSHLSSHLSLNREGRLGTTYDFATSCTTAIWDMVNSRPVHSLMLSSHLFFCLPCLLPAFTVPYKMVLADLMNGIHDQTTAVCVSLRSSGGLRVVRLPAGCWHGLPRW